MLAAIVLGLGNVYLFAGFVIPKNILVGIVVLLVLFPVMINSPDDDPLDSDNVNSRKIVAPLRQYVAPQSKPVTVHFK